MIEKTIAALSFLTILPIPAFLRGSEKSLSESAPYFPVAGLVIGLLLAGINHAGGLVLPPILLAAMMALGTSWISRGLHMDGLADTADGFLSGATGERVREIMKDSRIGAMGVIGVISVISLKTMALVSISPFAAGVALIITPIAGRCAMLYAMSTYPYVSGSRGLGHVFDTGGKISNALLSVAFVALTGMAALGFAGMLWGAVLFVVTLAFGRYCIGKIHGMTGDTYGALCEIVETVSLIYLSSLAHIQS